MNIEVFKSNVEKPEEAERITRAIETRFEKYKANFDLQDCDRILRVISRNGPVQAAAIISLLKEAGYEGAVLPDQ